MSNRLIVDSRISKISAEALEKMGYSLIYMPEIDVLPAPVSAHPDMSCVKIGDKWFAASDAAHLFDSCDVVICNREEGIILSYPKDISFNCAVIGNKIICNKKYTHKKIIEYANAMNFSIIDVSQGYAKCSTCIISDNAVITEDAGIYKSCISYGIDSLLIDKGHVRLDGYQYGFIGGCTGYVDGKLLVNGNLSLHPDYKKIHEFIIKHNTDICCLNNDKLYDVGSIVGSV